MVMDSAVVTMDSLQETSTDLLNGAIADPNNLPFPKMGAPSAPRRINFATRAATWWIRRGGDGRGSSEATEGREGGRNGKSVES